MKRIIDIDKPTFDDIIATNGIKCHLGRVDWCIRNSKPYEDRPKGEWIIDGHHYKCSRCGKTLAIMFSETDDDDLIGCPFCLADMRVKGRE